MNYLSLVFIIFLISFTFIYYLLKPNHRYIALFIGSYIFYGYANPYMLLVLIVVTTISYIGGLVLEKNKQRSLYVFFFSLEILILAFFKYTLFLVENINNASNILFSHQVLNINWNIALPIGLSFMIFQACTYLSDIYRNKMSVEKNVIKFAAFVAFFPTILSGPIQKSRLLLPQISNPKSFNYEDAKLGTLLFVWGAFEKIMVANKLSIIYNTIIPDYANRTSAELLLGTISFSLYIYADFSSYSDMASGVSKLLGIDIGKNFNNPYLSQSTAEFWNRWHISLNEWFIENVYIPLGGNRKGIIRKYINMIVVFFISGLWHGANWHFVLWGLINGLFAIIGLIIKPLKQKLYKLFNVNEKLESIVFIRRCIVFYLINLTWVFFTSSVHDSFMIWKRIVYFDAISIFDANLFNIAGNTTATFITAVCLFLFCKLQIKRQESDALVSFYNRQPYMIQCISIALIISICIFGAFATDSNVNTQYLYFQF